MALLLKSQSMKKLLPLLTALILFSCQKQERESTPKTYGADGSNPVVNTVIVSPSFKRRPKPPVTDTTTTPTPTDTTTKDTVVIAPPVSMPASFSLVMPAVQNQGSEGACVAFAATYIRASENYYRTGIMIPLSPEYLFNQTKSSTSCSGSAIIIALNFLQSNGVCTWASMPYSWVNGCSLLPNAQQTAEAANYRIKGYTSIPASDITAIKTALLGKHPLIIQVAADNEFTNATSGFVWRVNGSVVGYHAITICGWDDGKNAVQIINSWGTGWCDNGYGWIDYSLLSKVSSNPIQIVL